MGIACFELVVPVCGGAINRATVVVPVPARVRWSSSSVSPSAVVVGIVASEPSSVPVHNEIEVNGDVDAGVVEACGSPSGVDDGDCIVGPKVVVVAVVKTDVSVLVVSLVATLLGEEKDTQVHWGNFPSQ